MRRMVSLVLLFVFISILSLDCSSRHTSNYALIVDTSMFWFNYRHIANSLAVYRAVKAGGIPDSHIVLMLAEDIACNPRNILKGSVFDDDSQTIDLFDENVQVDYRGEEVTVENVLRVLSGRHLKGTPRSKRLDSDENSNVLVYFAGHGGGKCWKNFVCNKN
jgi:phosphatidylinositol glycan class K